MKSINQKQLIIGGIIILVVIAIIISVVSSRSNNNQEAVSSETDTSSETSADDSGDPYADSYQSIDLNDKNSTLKVTVNYTTTQDLPEGAVMTLRLLDTTLQDVASKTIAEQQITKGLNQPPLVVNLGYNSQAIFGSNTYIVGAHIYDSNENLLFVNDTAFEVLTGGSPLDEIEIELIPQPQT